MHVQRHFHNLKFNEFGSKYIDIVKNIKFSQNSLL